MGKVTSAGLMAGIFFGFIKLHYMPNLDLLTWVFIAMLFDFISGIIKSKMLKIPITSGRLRDSAIKSLQYIGVIVGCIIIANTVHETNEITTWINDGMLIFIIYCEVYSIIENLRDMKPDSKVSRLVFVPLLSILSLSITKAALKVKDESANDSDSK